MQNQGLLLLGGIAALWLLRQKSGDAPAVPVDAVDAIGGGGGGGGDGTISGTVLGYGVPGEADEGFGGAREVPVNGAASGGANIVVEIVSEAFRPVESAAKNDEDIGIDSGEQGGSGGMDAGKPPIIELPPSTEPVIKQDSNATRVPASSASAAVLGYDVSGEDDWFGGASEPVAAVLGYDVSGEDDWFGGAPEPVTVLGYDVPGENDWFGGAAEPVTVLGYDVSGEDDWFGGAPEPVAVLGYDVSGEDDWFGGAPEPVTVLGYDVSGEDDWFGE